MSWREWLLAISGAGMLLGALVYAVLTLLCSLAVQLMVIVWLAMLAAAA